MVPCIVLWFFVIRNKGCRVADTRQSFFFRHRKRKDKSNNMLNGLKKIVSRTDELMKKIRNGEEMARRDKVALAAWLSLPSMMAQLSTIIMEYIDASMVGSLGASASAAIGLVSTTIWLFGGVCSSCSTGFYVQVAHAIGANDMREARNVLRQSIVAVAILSVILMSVGLCISSILPQWLGGNEEICSDASMYFMIFCLSLPLLQMNSLGGGMLRSSGNMHIPSMLNVVMCMLDVVLNYLLIFPSRSVSVMGISVEMPGMGWGVKGAALATLAATGICAALMMWFCVKKSKELSLTGRQEETRYWPTKRVIKKALKIAMPMGVEHTIFCGAQIVVTKIVAPLGTAAIAANAFGVIVEGLCYMPGYGIGESATTLVGQSLGAGRTLLARSFARITVSMGIAIMSVMGVVMYVLAPYVMPLMTPDILVQAMTVEALRIEAFAEPMFAASIVCYGVFVGAGDTLVPCIMNLASIWLVRITLSSLLVGSMGLNGVWIAMCVELCFRGVIFLMRLASSKWSRINVGRKETEPSTDKA